MSLLKDLKPPVRKYSCKVRTLTNAMEKDDAKILMDAINNINGWPARTLQNALEERGIILSDLTINRHRRGTCSCLTV